MPEPTLFAPARAVNSFRPPSSSEMPARLADALKANGRKVGAFKRAARLAGLSFSDYLSRVSSGQKRCTACRQWKSVEAFGAEAGRWDGRCPKCLACHNFTGRLRHNPIDPLRWKPLGPERADPREGDKEQARHLINLDVQYGRRPNPNELHCAKCGHKGDDRRHEYHHHMGYAARHHYDVIPLCSTCHHEEH